MRSNANTLYTSPSSTSTLVTLLCQLKLTTRDNCKLWTHLVVLTLCTITVAMQPRGKALANRYVSLARTNGMHVTLTLRSCNGCPHPAAAVMMDQDPLHSHLCQTVFTRSHFRGVSSGAWRDLSKQLLSLLAALAGRPTLMCEALTDLNQ